MKKKMKKKTKSKKQQMKTFACFARDLKNTTQEKKKKNTMSGKINIEFKWKRVKSLRFIYSKYLLAFPRIPSFSPPPFPHASLTKKTFNRLVCEMPTRDPETHTK